MVRITDDQINQLLQNCRVPRPPTVRTIYAIPCSHYSKGRLVCKKHGVCSGKCDNRWVAQEISVEPDGQVSVYRVSPRCLPDSADRRFVCEASKVQGEKPKWRLERTLHGVYVHYKIQKFKELLSAVDLTTMTHRVS